MVEDGHVGGYGVVGAFAKGIMGQELNFSGFFPPCLLSGSFWVLGLAGLINAYWVAVHSGAIVL